jgi:hypothetical protein
MLRISIQFWLFSLLFNTPYTDALLVPKMVVFEDVTSPKFYIPASLTSVQTTRVGLHSRS